MRPSGNVQGLRFREYLEECHFAASATCGPVRPFVHHKGLVRSRSVANTSETGRTEIAQEIDQERQIFRRPIV